MELYFHRLLETQIVLDFLRTLDPMATHHRGCAAAVVVVAAGAAAAAALVDRLDDGEYCQVTLQDPEFRLMDLEVADVDVKAAVNSAVAVSEGSEPWHPRVSVMQGRRET